MKRWYIAALAAIILFATTPFVSTLLASLVANTAACTLNEASPTPCIIYGHDCGELLYMMGMGIWMSIFTIPVSEIALLIWAITLIIHLLIRRQRRGRYRWLA